MAPRDVPCRQDGFGNALLARPPPSELAEVAPNVSATSSCSTWGVCQVFSVVFMITSSRGCQKNYNDLKHLHTIADINIHRFRTVTTGSKHELAHTHLRMRMDERVSSLRQSRTAGNDVHRVASRRAARCRVSVWSTRRTAGGCRKIQMLDPGRLPRSFRYVHIAPRYC